MKAISVEQFRAISKTKYRNKKVKHNGLSFDSMKEYRRYLELKILEGSGEIKNLECQKRFDLLINAIRICSYYADFVYKQGSKTVVEDVKGYRGGGAYAIFKLKKKLMKAIWAIEIIEI